MSTALTIVISILLFSFLIFIHEFGHFITAKLFKVQVNEFSMFMGPAIFRKKYGETEYTLRCIPFGGYCAMEGEDGDSDNPRAFSKADWWKRLIILVAGALMNFVAGLLLIAIMYAPNQEFAAPIVDYLEPNSSLSEGQGLEVGDRIVSIDGERVNLLGDFTMLLSLKPGDTHQFTVERNGEKVVLPSVSTVKRDFGGEEPLYGISFGYVEATPAVKATYVWKTGLNFARIVRISLKMLFSGEAGLKDMVGPVGLVHEISEATAESETAAVAMDTIVYFFAFIAINLGVMNLLPIPALDGGRAVCLVLTSAVEAILRRKIDPKYEAYLHGVGLVLLLILMAVVSFKDIFGLF